MSKVTSGVNLAAGERLHALDAVRAFALLLGVIHHATLSFVPDIPAGVYAPVNDVSPSTTLALIAFTGHMFRMSLFFLLAGFFARMVVLRKGVVGFSADRLQRILVPLVVGWMVFNTLVRVAWKWGEHHSITLPTLPAGFSSLQLGYLWFLYYLLVLYALALAGRAVLLAIDRDGTLRRVADTVTRRVMESRFAGPALLSVPMAAGLLTLKGLEMLGGVPTPNFSLIPTHLAVSAYGFAFGFGWMAHRNSDALGFWRQRWKGYLVAAVLFTAACIVVAERVGASASEDFSLLQKLTLAASYSVASWCWILGIVGAAIRFLSSHNPARRYIADASYWIYLAHYPVVVALQGAMSQWPLHWSLKFSAILLVTLSFSLFTYHYLVRYSFIGRVLNGRSFPRARASTAGAASVS